MTHISDLFKLALIALIFLAVLPLTNCSDDSRPPLPPNIPTEIAILTCYGDTLFSGKVLAYRPSSTGIEYIEPGGKTTVIYSNTITTIERNKTPSMMNYKKK